MCLSLPLFSDCNCPPILLSVWILLSSLLATACASVVNGAEPEIITRQNRLNFLEIHFGTQETAKTCERPKKRRLPQGLLITLKMEQLQRSRPLVHLAGLKMLMIYSIWVRRIPTTATSTPQIRSPRASSLLHSNFTSDNNLPILPISSLNVCALRTKLDYHVSIEKITSYKIVLLQETKANVIDSNRIELFSKNNDFTCFIKKKMLGAYLALHSTTGRL